MKTEDYDCYEDCSVPICPKNPLLNAQWFPDEGICNAKHLDKPPWVKTQRKIQRLFLKGLIAADECFTIPLMDSIKRVGKGLHGIKPENLHRNHIDKDAQKPSISCRMPFFKAVKGGITSSCM